MATEKKTSKGLLLRGNIYHMRFTVKGHKVAESTYTSILREAEHIMAKRKAELIQDVVLDGKSVVTLHKAIDEYTSSRGTEGAKKTAQYNLSAFKALKDTALKSVTKNDLRQVIAACQEDGKKVSTINLHIRYWNIFCNFCAAHKYHTPPKLEIFKGVKGRTRWLTVEEEARLLQALEVPEMYRGKRDWLDARKQDNYDFVVTLLDTGMRFMEAANMHWNQVDFEKNQIYVHRLKGGRDTVLTITDRLRAILLRRRQMGSEVVFPIKEDNNKSKRWLDSAAQRAGISIAQGNITPHVMRHTFAVRMIQNGVQLNEIQYLLGHSTLEMTSRYAHFIKQDAAGKAADVLNRIAAKSAPRVDNVVPLAA